MKTEAVIPFQDERVAWKFAMVIVSGNHLLRSRAIRIMKTIKDTHTVNYIKVLVNLIVKAELTQNQHNQ